MTAADAKGKTVECEVCGGVGIIYWAEGHNVDGDWVGVGMSTPCDKCHGTGRLIIPVEEERNDKAV